MKANELRLGNWVNVQPHAKYAQIIEIKSVRPDNRDFVRISSPYLDTQFSVEISQVEPIPLTEEILIKAGFKEEYDGWVFGKTIFITKDDDGWHVGNFGFFINSIQYLHDLQNLIFALTGEEIKIDL